MSDDPKPITPADLAAPALPRRRRHAPWLQDAEGITPEERAERAAYAARVAAFQRLAGKVHGLNASEVNRAVQAATTATLDRLWRQGARTRANDRGVPRRDDVRRVALRADPPAREALDAVRAWLAWRARTRIARRSEHVAAVLVLCAAAGRGKSSAAGWAVAWHRDAALYTDAAHVAAHPATAHTDTHAPWAALVAPDLLAIDEVGREPGDRGPTTVRELYLARDARGRATLLLGNCTAEEFVARYVAPDGAVASRFEQQARAGFDPIREWRGDDLRLTEDP